MDTTTGSLDFLESPLDFLLGGLLACSGRGSLFLSLYGAIDDLDGILLGFAGFFQPISQNLDLSPQRITVKQVDKPVIGGRINIHKASTDAVHKLRTTVVEGRVANKALVEPPGNDQELLQAGDSSIPVEPGARVGAKGIVKNGQLDPLVELVVVAINSHKNHGTERAMHDLDIYGFVGVGLHDVSS